MERRRTILGIDPGLALLGYGIVETNGDAVQHVAHGCLTTPAGAPLPFRLRLLYEALTDIKRRYTITDVAVESLFHSRNVRTAMAVGQARGVALLATVELDTALGEYSPTDVKLAIAGFGAASKRQIQEMVRLLLRLDADPKPDDAADALAVALCHARHAHFSESVERAAAGDARV